MSCIGLLKIYHLQKFQMAAPVASEIDRGRGGGVTAMDENHRASMLLCYTLQNITLTTFSHFSKLYYYTLSRAVSWFMRRHCIVSSCRRQMHELQVKFRKTQSTGSNYKCTHTHTHSRHTDLTNLVFWRCLRSKETHVEDRPTVRDVSTCGIFVELCIVLPYKNM
jgi:hypothetical protein